MKKKKILFGLEATSGGALKHLTYLTSNLNKDDFEITVALSRQRPDYDEFFVQKMNIPGVRLVFIPMSRTINLRTDIQAFLKIYRIIKENRFNIVHAHSSKAGLLFRLAAWINRVPQVIYTPHCFYFQSKRGAVRKLFIILEKLLGYFCHQVIVSEHEQKLALINKIIPKRKLVNINNAINFDEYKQYNNIQKIKAEWNIPLGFFVVGAVGRLTAQKDWHTFIKTAESVLSEINNVVFIIAGSGTLKNELSQMISDRDLSSNIKLLGHVHDISKVYSIMDLFVSTSLWEGLPYAYLEAGHFKKPVVATDTFDHISMENDFGFVTTPVRKYQIAASEIVKVVRDNARIKILGEKTYRIISHKYSFNRFVEQHKLLYLKNNVSL